MRQQSTNHKNTASHNKEKSTHKKTILFVGAFKKSADDGTIGGQTVASRSLAFSEYAQSNVNWILLDSTLKRVPLPPLPIRALSSVKRVFKYIYFLIKYKPQIAILMTSAGASFLEKGLMVKITTLFPTKSILSPRSGNIPEQIEKSSLFKSLVKSFLRSVDIVWCQSKTWKNYYEQLVYGQANDKMIVQENWIDINLQVNTNKDGNFTHIIYIARVEKEKGVLDFINALSLVKEQLDKTVVHLCGDGSILSDVKELVDQLGLSETVIFYGNVYGDKKIALLEKSHILIFPSYFEGFPNTVLEGMLYSLAIVATNVGAIPDMLKNRQTGILINPGDIDALSKNILLLIKDKNLRKKLGENARAKVINNNSIEIAVDNLTNL